MLTRSFKHKAAASEIAAPAKRSTEVAVPEVVADLLRALASSLNAATLDLMALPTTDVAARGRVVAVMADCKRQLNNVIGGKRRNASVLAISDVIIDAFQFLPRKELDTLQVVCVRFNTIIVEKLKLVCPRMLLSAKISRGGANNHFVLVMHEVGASEETLLPTVVDDEAAATELFLNACQSSRVYNVELYGTTSMNERFLDFLALRAPAISAMNFCMGKRSLADGVEHLHVFRTLQAFGELGMVQTKAHDDANLQDCLIRNCFKAGLKLASDGLVFGKKCDTSIVENALLEFCFGACDERYATRDRFLSVLFSKPLKSDFLKRWVERAEVTDCRHKLILSITTRQGLTPQDADALDGYKQNGQTERKVSFGSVSGRRWTAECINDGICSNRITLRINYLI